ncbi:MAG: DUF2334 domain-containing protein, partial [Bacteroidota bacterium]
LYQLAITYQMKLTWFLHVQAHEEWLHYFHYFQNQEIALHGYEHGTAWNSTKLKKNIEKGLRIMIEHSLTPQGFCAPYAIWDRHLQMALSGFEFEYSSEFTFGYDTYPIHLPEMELYQVPIHPICTGSLARKGASEAQMESYFNQVFERKNARFEPHFYYHHPMQPGLGVVESLFGKARGKKLLSLTFLEFVQFWKYRSQCSMEVSYHPRSFQITSEGTIWFEVHTQHEGFYLTKASDSIDVKTLNYFQFGSTPVIKSKKRRQLEEHSLQLLKTSILDFKNRKRL